MRLPVDSDRKRYRKFGFKLGENIHLGHDFDIGETKNVYAIAEGVVLEATEINGFGGLNPSKKGGACFIEHSLPDGKKFTALYGHVLLGCKKGQKVKKGELIGTILPFWNGDAYCPHLHFGIHLKGGMPETPYGYNKTAGNWVNPLEFLETYKDV